MAIFNTVPPLAAGAGIKFDGERISTAAAPRNWLDNSDFTNLIAQAGIGGKHGSVAYAADRWKLTSGTVTYTAGTGLTLNGTITQVLETAPTGGSWFVGMASGTATIALNGNIITITSNGGVIKWAALYEGTYTEANRPGYQPKGYAAELLECQRYYEVVKGGGSISQADYGDSHTRYGFSFLKKRIKPSVSIIEFWSPGTYGQSDMGTLTVQDVNDQRATIVMDGAKVAGFYASAQFEVSADL